MTNNIRFFESATEILTNDIYNSSFGILMTEKLLDIVDTRFVFVQKDESEERVLTYDYKKCVGCGICVYACPVNAIELQPVHDIALGLDMPPIMIDHTKCVFCGICFTFCFFNAFEFRINDVVLRKEDMPVYPKGFIKKTDTCVNCAICYKVCPTKAIERKIKLRRDDIQARNEGIVGNVTIDKDKCSYCGICVEFCNAFRAIEGDPLKPYQDILFDSNKCDYCKLCEDICPNKAIEVEGKRIIEDSLLDVAEVVLNVDACIFCGRCSKACPYEGVEHIKPITGKLILSEQFDQKCDPIGCKACMLICPTKAWFLEEGKMKVDEDICIHCGACENACPYDLIAVERIDVRVIINESPWTEGWMKAVDRIVSKSVAEEGDGRDVVIRL